MPSQESKTFYDPPTDFEFIVPEYTEVAGVDRADIEEEAVEAAWEKMTGAGGNETH